MGHEYCLSKCNCCGCWLSDGSACIHKVLDIFVGHARATLRVKLVSPSELYLVGLSVMLQAIEKHLPGHIGLFCRSSAQTCSASRDLRPLARPTSFPIAKRPCFEKSSTDAWHLPLDLDSSLASRHKVFRVLWDPNTIQRSFDSWPVLKHGGRPCVDKFQPQLFCVHNFLTCNAVTDTNFKNY